MEPNVQPVTVPKAPDAPGDALQLYVGRTMRDALLKARKELGEKAIVVEQRTEAGRVRLAVSPRVPRSTDALRKMREEASAVLDAPPPAPAPGRQVAGVPAGAPGTSSSGARSPLADVERRLREHGASKKLRERVLEGIVARGANAGHPLDLAADVVGGAFDVAKLPTADGQTAVIALLGQTGVGKTTTLAKLALRLVRAGRKVALATLDTERVGAVEQARAFGKALRIPTIALTDAVRLADDLGRAPGRFDVVLIDGTGHIGDDVRTLGAFRARCEEARVPASLHTLVALPATGSQRSLKEVTDAAAPLGPLGTVVTKIDEASQPLPALEHAVAEGLGIAFITNGPELAPHFFRASAERFADVALLGRIG